MIVPIPWLNQYIDGPTDAKVLAEKFTYIGYMLDKPIQQVGDFEVLDLEVRQNRSDCLSLIGLARELGAVIDKPVHMPVLADISQVPSNQTTINITDSDLCYRFNTLTISGIKNIQSPEWMQKQLQAYGIKTVNALVDITNYVMIELGQPLHAFDASTIVNKSLTIRLANDGESIMLLGKKDVKLTTDDLVIADESGPIAIAGIMGGEEKGITEDTTRIILEAATYNQANIRRSTIRHDTRTEASTRLEKFLHPHLTELALARAAYLINEITGGEVVDHTDSYLHVFPDKTIDLRLSQVHRLTGLDFDLKTVETILKKLDIATSLKDKDTIICLIPYFRTDLELEADLIEEVIRIYGYDQIPMFPLSGGVPADIQSTTFILEEDMKDILVSLGYNEVITEPLSFEANPKHESIMLENSLTAEKTMLRTTLEYSMEHALQEYKKHNLDTIKLFEIGKIYYKNSGNYFEERHVGVMHYSSGEINLREVIGNAEALLERSEYEYSATYVTVSYVDRHTIFVDINLDLMMKSEKKNFEKVATAPLQNIIKEDFSFTTTDPEADYRDLLNKVGLIDPIIRGIELKNGPTKLENNSLNSLLTVSFYSPDVALTKNDIEPVRAKILDLLKTRG